MLLKTNTGPMILSCRPVPLTKAPMWLAELAQSHKSYRKKGWTRGRNKRRRPEKRGLLWLKDNYLCTSTSQCGAVSGSSCSVPEGLGRQWPLCQEEGGTWGFVTLSQHHATGRTLEMPRRGWGMCCVFINGGRRKEYIQMVCTIALKQLKCGEVNIKPLNRLEGNIYSTKITGCKVVVYFIQSIIAIQYNIILYNIENRKTENV